MTFSESNDEAIPMERLPNGVEEDAPPPSTSSQGTPPPIEADERADSRAEQRRRILIGSQRDPAAYRARQKRDWTPVADEGETDANERKKKEKNGPRKAQPTAVQPPRQPESQLARQQPGKERRAAEQESHEKNVKPSDVRSSDLAAAESLERAGDETTVPPSPVHWPAPRVPLPPAEGTTDDLEAELDRAMGDASMDDLLGGGSKQEDESFEPGSLQSGRVVALRRDDVFVEFGGRQQGIVSLRQLDVPPRVGADVQVVVQRLNPEDGLYELSVPNKAVQVDDWSDLVEGALVDVRVTGHNTGGLECEVNHIRGFIPVSQVGLYRVDDLAPYVDQRLACVIVEADPERRNLVLSRRAVLEREKEQAKQLMLETLRPGQIHEGVVRKLMDFGAFVDIGSGVDGLVHVSQLAWGRVKHPSDVLQEGQSIKVRIEKFDAATGKISLAYRDLMESPWSAAAQKYPPQTVAKGTVTKLMDFGAFVEVEPGIEGLVHISELSPKRVWRTSDVVKEGQEVEVLVLSIDPSAQRMSLSMKALAAPPEPAKKDEPAEPAKASKKSTKPTGPLLGGLGRKTGSQFGLKW